MNIVEQKSVLVLVFNFLSFVQCSTTHQTEILTTCDGFVSSTVIVVLGVLFGISLVGNVVCMLLVLMKKKRVGPVYIPVDNPVKQPHTLDNPGVWV